MNFGQILTGITKAVKPTKPVDAYALVNGKLSNEAICDNMLEGGSESPEVLKYMQSLGQDLGFSDSDSQLFWG